MLCTRVRIVCLPPQSFGRRPDASLPTLSRGRHLHALSVTRGLLSAEHHMPPGIKSWIQMSVFISAVDSHRKCPDNKPHWFLEVLLLFALAASVTFYHFWQPNPLSSITTLFSLLLHQIKLCLHLLKCQVFCFSQAMTVLTGLWNILFFFFFKLVTITKTDRCKYNFQTSMFHLVQCC